MALISPSEFQDWRSNPVTKAFFDAANIRIQEAKDVLGHSAGSEPLYDRHLVGMIAAYEEMKEFKVEGMEND